MMVVEEFWGFGFFFGYIIEVFLILFFRWVLVLRFRDKRDGLD